MARKLNTKTAENVRAHIQGLMLVNLLQNHALGKAEISDERRDSAKFLLSYALPKPAQQVEATGSLTISWAK
jgi:hypothetical protein